MALAFLLVPVMLLEGVAAAQESKPVFTPGAQPQTSSGTLKILVLEGQNGVTNIRLNQMVMVVVEVRDEDDRPVEGAKVEFQLPLMGPSGSFEGGVRSKEATTNVQGQVSSTYTPNSDLGRFQIQVKATLGPRTGTATIAQRNATESEPIQSTRKVGGHKKLIIAVAVVVAGGVAAAILATRGGSSAAASTPKPTLTITPGVPTVGGTH